MSNRTYEATKAIAIAWIKEQQLVAEGKGTVDWTQSQQYDILDKGKTYDEDGKAFEGHHMKSAEMYPEYQGDPENIQFLSRQEHKEAHGGNFQNPTNGYYDPISKITKDFGEGIYEPCKVIELSDPVSSYVNQKTTNRDRESFKENEDKTLKKPELNKAVVDSPSKVATSRPNHDVPETQSPPTPPKIKKVGGVIHHIVKTAKDIAGFVVEHKEAFITGAIVLSSVVLKALVSDDGGSNEGRSDRGSSKSGYQNSNGYSYVPFDDEGSSYGVEADDSYEFNDSESNEHSSPIEHTVSPHRQRYNGVWKDKDPYTRGGKK